MNQLPNTFNAPIRVLLGPGPSDVPPRVLAAMASPTIGHLDPEYSRLMDETRQMLRQVFRTQNEMTFAASGTGSAGMEAAVVNLIEPGDEMIVCVNGVFGTRMLDVAQRAGAVVHPIEAEWGRTIEPSRGGRSIQEISKDESARNRSRGNVNGGPSTSWKRFRESCMKRGPCFWWTPSRRWAVWTCESTNGKLTHVTAALRSVCHARRAWLR